MSDTKEQEKRETAMECLIGAMEAFSKDEPVDIIVVYTTESGEVWYLGNGVEPYKAIGLLEIVKVGIANEQCVDAEDE